FKGLLATNVYPYLLAAIGIFIMLYVYENKLVRRGADPILPVTLMKQPRFLVTLLIGALSGAMLSAMIFVPAFSQQVLGISAEHSGYWMTPLALAAGIGAGLGGALVDKRGPIIAVALSGFVAAIGFLLFPLWIDVKWQFIVASVVSGVGMGILLGAPLNMLATEKLQDNKGTALASLSLVRTIGMTIAPTIYAGFIARGFNELPTLFQTDFMAKFQQNMQGVELSQAGAQELQQLGAQFASADMSQQQMIESVNAVQDPALKEAVMLTVQQLNEMAAQQGYGGLFMSAAVISAGVLLLAFVLKPLREK
ncbi:MAG: MFS transporter, partial [Caryophanon sp.]|nr:MFS transporter [Caryophanon sp.]